MPPPMSLFLGRVGPHHSERELYRAVPHPFHLSDRRIHLLPPEPAGSREHGGQQRCCGMLDRRSQTVQKNLITFVVFFLSSATSNTGTARWPLKLLTHFNLHILWAGVTEQWISDNLWWRKRWTECVPMLLCVCTRAFTWRCGHFCVRFCW